MRALSLAVALFTLVGVCAPGALGAQEPLTLTGLVQDSADQPIADVLVFVDDGTASGLTDTLGVFRLEGVAPDARVLSYRKMGFAPRSFGLGPESTQLTRDLGTVVLQPGPEPTATLVGQVTEGIGGQPLAGATIELNGEILSVTDSAGAFEVPAAAVRWGANAVTVRHRSFDETTAADEFWITNTGTTLDFSVALDVAPLGLPGVEVPVRSTVLETSGFYERREDYNGVFMTREEIVARNPRRLDDLFEGLSGRGASRSRAASTFGRADDGQTCRPVFFLDGLLINGSFADMRDRVTPETVEGLEIYTSIARLPAQFSPIGANCGVIVIWTR